MEFYVPEIGTLIKLEENWIFTLYSEYRNITLYQSLNKIGESSIDSTKNIIVELPKGLYLKIDRIYIRKGLSQYSSITFSVPKCKNKKDYDIMPNNKIYGGSKFWVKLHECNGMKISYIKKNPKTSELFNVFFSKIEKDASSKFGIEKCTKMISQINRLLGDGQNINNVSTYLNYDQFLSNLINKISDDTFLSNYLRDWFKSEMRDFKIKNLIN